MIQVSKLVKSTKEHIKQLIESSDKKEFLTHENKKKYLKNLLMKRWLTN